MDDADSGAGKRIADSTFYTLIAKVRRSIVATLKRINITPDEGNK